MCTHAYKHTVSYSVDFFFLYKLIHYGEIGIWTWSLFLWWQVCRSQFSWNECIWHFDIRIRIINNVWTWTHPREGTKLMDILFLKLIIRWPAFVLMLLNRLSWAVMCINRVWSKCCTSCKQWPLRNHINTVSSSLVWDNQVPGYCSTGFWSHHCYKIPSRSQFFV